MVFDSIESVGQYLDNIPQFQSAGARAANFDLSRFKKFCTLLGDPQHAFPAIHVAGTNGKGSTCRILATVLQQADYDVGLYTSPHIDRFNERFQINDNVISDEQLIAFFDIYADRFKEQKLTYFEISTALAFWWFRESEVDIAIIETGLGGRLDATNVIEPLVSVITSISLDHTDFLGDTIGEIAREKAGIIKQGHPTVIGDLPGEAEHEIREIAQQKGSSVSSITSLKPAFRSPSENQLTVDGRTMTFSSDSLRTPVQAKNIAISWLTIQQISARFPVSVSQFSEGVAQVDPGRGRFERLTDTCRWYFDGGHNLEAVTELKRSVKTLGEPDQAILVLSMMKDKVRRRVMSEFLEFQNIYYYQLNLERAASFDDIVKWLPQAKPFPDDRRQELLNNDFNSELVIFTGSFYFYATVREWVNALDNR